MKSKVSNKPFLYISLTIGLFVVLLLLDKVFGFHYEPIDYKESTELNYSDNTPIDVSDTLSNKETIAEQTEPLDTLEVKTQNVTESYHSPEHQISTPDELSAPDYFENLISTYRTNVLSKLQKNKSRTDIVIRYYHHQPDGNSAYALGELGYYIHEREVDKQYMDFQSNAIYYGDSVSLNDLQIVSFVLLNQGLPIKVIKPSRFHDSWKAHSIEIGADTTSIHKSTITLEQLRRISL